VNDVDGDRYRTDTQQEWADWSAHGYRKLYQPRSMLWSGEDALARCAHSDQLDGDLELALDELDVAAG
jgi:hypothetical protein